MLLEHDAIRLPPMAWPTSSAPVDHLETGEVSDHGDAAVLNGNLPAADWLWADRSYDADRSRNAPLEKDFQALHPRSEVPQQRFQIRQV